MRNGDEFESNKETHFVILINILGFYFETYKTIVKLSQLKDLIRAALIGKRSKPDCYTRTFSQFCHAVAPKY